MIMHARSCAKLNLSLDVMSRRADGYHELASVVHGVGLWDEIRFDFSVPALALSCDDASLQTPSNLVLRAAQLYADATDTTAACRIRLHKRIPFGAGLGGGSGNAAATLLAFNRAHDERLSPEELSVLGAQLGADVPLFLHDGPSLMEGVGERLSDLPVVRGHVVVVQPEMALFTPDVYRAFDALQTPSRRDTPALLHALQVENGEQLPAVAACLGNDLQSAAQTLGAPMHELCALLRELGALGACMSGSGSACFGVFSSRDEAEIASPQVAAKALHSKLRVRFAAAAALERSWIELSAL